MWESNTVEENGIRLHYTRTGGAKPPLILAHGITDNGLCWTDVAGVLQADYDVIMVDARGHGLSDAPEEGYDWMRFAKDLLGVIDRLQLQKPIILGHSMGALTALIAASLGPDGIYNPIYPKAILLEDPPAMWMPSTGADAARAEGIRDWILSLKGKSRDELLDAQRLATPHWSETELKNWADSKLQVSPNVAKIIGTNKDFSSLFRTIECLALLITADPARDAIVTRETAANLKAFVPQLEIVHVADAGHSIHRDKFEDYMRVVQAFLKGL